ncbi:ComEC/Rec2 family competence protein, partial [Candidatus Parcubacteria bacterium]|nr:ComEC/Rec2 family competence protein [Candidatus Parcubacteria bacterium]
TTIAVEIFILPALLYFMGILSFVSLPANILVLPVVPWTMLLGFITGLLSMLHIPLSIVTGLATDLLLRYMIFVAHTSASLPFSSLTIPAFPVWVVLIIYAPLLFIASRVYWRTASR